MEARDPYCGWDHKQKRCTTIEDSSNMNQWTQNITECPVRHTQTNTISWMYWYYTIEYSMIFLRLLFHIKKLLRTFIRFRQIWFLHVHFSLSNPLCRWGTWPRMAVLALGLHGNPATTMTVRAPSAAVCVDPARVTDPWPGVVGSIVKAQPSRWQTVPGTRSYTEHNIQYILCGYSISQQ